MGPFFFILIAIVLVAYLSHHLYVSRKERENTYIENGAKHTIYGCVECVDSIDSNAVSKIELYSDKIMINRVAIIPIKRIEKAEYSKVIKKEPSENGNLVNRYFGELKILFTDKNGQEAFIQCHTSKHDQFNLMFQYENMAKEINNLTGVGNQIITTPIQEPYEL